MKYKPEMTNHDDAQQIFTKAGWNSSFQLLGELTYLFLDKEGSEPHHLLVPDESYTTHRLPAWFFLNAFAEVGISAFAGYEPKTHQLPKWGFRQVGRHYAKQHPAKPTCKVTIYLEAGPSDPYLLLVNGLERETLLLGQPQSIFHFLHALEANGFFEQDEPTGQPIQNGGSFGPRGGSPGQLSSNTAPNC